ncbi:MAG TPA: PSD1 and planctomycete cytochrome C domain-containing protein [Planctomycetota bacterium]|nr:PSD1 and planctomycete cytochrome C domain-containing protein [Planctomycetota bacterium]
MPAVRSLTFLAALLGAIAAERPRAQTFVEPVRYGRDVRPILADRCFRCHGPDAQAREADLRLDLREQALAARDGGAAIVPFDPAASLLWQRVCNEDADERMPPQRSGKPRLSPAELAVVADWILAGADYEPHWAFVAPRRPPVPTATIASSNPVDRFLAERLQRAGRQPSPEADRTTLVRRLFLVLTGLPPTPEEVADFIADPAPDAYERLVDRLLGTEPYRTRHAEHLAQPWLDAARYADTSGIHMDAGRQAWPWRDWLISALRDDMPFDRFVVEQLAGDLLPGATQDQIVASGFLRQHITTDEGGAIDEEYRVEYAAERTATLGSVFLGLTLGCARCHDHKFDPIRQEDYYRLFSFFNSNEEPGLYSQSTNANRALEPFLAVPSPAQHEQRTELEHELEAARAALAEHTPEDVAALAGFRADLARELDAHWHVAPVVEATSRGGATMTVQPDGSVLASGPNPARDTHVLLLRAAAPEQRWLCLEALTDPSLPEGKVGRAPNGNAVLQHLRLECRPLGSTGDFVRVPLIWAMADVEQDDGDFGVTNALDDDRDGWAVGAHQHPAGPRHALLLAAEPFGGELRLTLAYDSQYAEHAFGRVRVHTGTMAESMARRLPPAASGFHLAGPFTSDAASDLYEQRFGPEEVRTIDRQQRWGKTGWRFDATLKSGVVNAGLPSGRNVTFVGRRVYSAAPVEATLSLGSDDGFQLFANGSQVAERRIDRPAGLDQDEAHVQLPEGPSVLVLKVVNTGGDGGFAWRDVAAPEALQGDLRLALLPPSVQDETLVARFEEAFRLQRSPTHRARLAKVASLTEALDQLDAATPMTMVMHEAAMPRATFVLQRGDYDKPDKTRPVSRELPQMFGELPPGAPHDRLGLAQWLVSAQDPLFARVAMNRLWEFVFGTGIVRTSEDFGRQGEWPSHPELLDWLAMEFRDRGFSRRTMLRLLVTSATFRQQSRLPDDAGDDRDDRLLGWFPRRRLAAEAIRDQALYVSGLLVEKVGGPSVKPYQPPGLWQEVAMVQSNTRRFVRGNGDDLWRRSLYTYWKRACPPPSLLALDAPTREFCTIRRLATNTPLQALVLWNDEQFLEGARCLAQRALREAATDDERLQAMYRRCTGSSMDDNRLARARDALRAARERFAGRPADAEALAHIGEAPVDAACASGDTAAFLLLASAFLNLDKTICID